MPGLVSGIHEVLLERRSLLDSGVFPHPVRCGCDRGSGRACSDQGPLCADSDDLQGTPTETPHQIVGKVEEQPAFFGKPLRFRGLLAQAEEDDIALRLDDADLAAAAQQICEICAAAARRSAA
jgi:hypothetical protein